MDSRGGRWVDGERCPCLWRGGQLTLLSESRKEQALLLSAAWPGPPMPSPLSCSHLGPSRCLAKTSPLRARLGPPPSTAGHVVCPEPPNLPVCVALVVLHTRPEPPLWQVLWELPENGPFIWAPGKARPGPTSSLPAPHCRAILNTWPCLPHPGEGPFPSPVLPLLSPPPAPPPAPPALLASACKPPSEGPTRPSPRPWKVPRHCHLSGPWLSPSLLAPG